jgi:hypothetical protein
MSSTLLYKAFIALVLTASASSLAQQPFVTCWDDMSRKVGYRTHIWKSTAFSNQEGASALVELEAKPTAHDDCTNTSRLYVRQSADQPYTLAFTAPVDSDTQGNSLELVGWSGKQLLLNESSWTYHGDAFYSQPVIYDIETGSVSRPKIGELISTEIHKDCVVKAVATRWLGQEIELTAQDNDVEYSDDEADGCLTGRPKVWIFNPSSNVVRPKR